jgi:hypothetical protein
VEKSSASFIYRRVATDPPLQKAFKSPLLGQIGPFAPIPEENPPSAWKRDAEDNSKVSTTTPGADDDGVQELLLNLMRPSDAEKSIDGDTFASSDEALFHARRPPDATESMNSSEIYACSTVSTVT